eukprot:1467352-Pyramimonas_sp.AAC.1
MHTSERCQVLLPHKQPLPVTPHRRVGRAGPPARQRRPHHTRPERFNAAAISRHVWGADADADADRLCGHAPGPLKGEA